MYIYSHICSVVQKKQNGPTNNKRHQHDILTFLGVNLGFTFIFPLFSCVENIARSRRQPAFSCLKILRQTGKHGHKTNHAIIPSSISGNVNWSQMKYLKILSQPPLQIIQPPVTFSTANWPLPNYLTTVKL